MLMVNIEKEGLKMNFTCRSHGKTCYQFLPIENHFEMQFNVKLLLFCSKAMVERERKRESQKKKKQHGYENVCSPVKAQDVIFLEYDALFFERRYWNHR